MDSQDPPVRALDLLYRHLVARLGYAPAELPELQPLRPWFERVLVRSDGLAFEVVCLRDRAGSPEGRAEVDLEAMLRAGEACLPFTGEVQGHKLPVTLRVWELRGEADLGVAHLRPLRSLGLQRKVHLTAWSLWPASQAIWTNAPLGGWLVGRLALRGLLRQVAAGIEPGRRAEAVAQVARPLLTWGLVAAMAIHFGLQILSGEWRGLLAPTVDALVATGALVPPLVLEHGHYHRLLSAAALHGGLVHLLLNGLALAAGGALLEPLLGRAWLLAILLVSVLGGSVASLLLNGPDLVSVGASGGIMGILAAAALTSRRLPHGPERTSAQLTLLGFLVPALIPLATHRLGGRVDYAAHLGGLLAGGALGLVALRTWGDQDPAPRLRWLPRSLAAIAVVALTGSVGLAWAGRPAILREQAMMARFGPDERFDVERGTPLEALAVKVEGLRRDYPLDPRTDFLAALVAVDQGRPADAEARLRHGLEDPELLRIFFKNGWLELRMRSALAMLLLKRGQDDEAARWFRPACGIPRDATPPGLTPAWVAATCGP